MKIVVYKRWRKGTQEGSSAIGQIEVDLPESSVRNPQSGWRKKVAEAVAKIGGRIEAISTIHSHAEGFHIVVTLAADTKLLQQPGRAVTRGGRMIERPQARRTLGTLTRGKV